MVITNVPTCADLRASSTKVDVSLVSSRRKNAFTPCGTPETDRCTLRWKPLSGVTVMVLLAVDSGVMLKLLGEAESAKSGVVLCEGSRVMARTLTRGSARATLLTVLVGLSGRKYAYRLNGRLSFVPSELLR